MVTAESKQSPWTFEVESDLRRDSTKFAVWKSLDDDFELRSGFDDVADRTVCSGFVPSEKGRYEKD